MAFDFDQNRAVFGYGHDFEHSTRRDILRAEEFTQGIVCDDIRYLAALACR